MSAGALGFLIGHSARNRIVSVASRLRSPRYAVGMLVGAAYFVVVLGNPVRHRPAHAPLDPTSAIVTLAPLGLAALVAWWWLRGGFQSVLAFTPAEADFLFPAPVRRRTLVAYKLLRAQVGIVFTAAIFLMFFPVTLPLWWPLAFASLWMLVTALHWHQLAASLVRADLMEHTTAAARRGALPVIVFLAACVALLTGLIPELPAIRAAADAHEMFARVGAALQHPGPRIVLYPFRLLLAPMLAPDTSGWMRAVPAAFAILALHFAWVFRTDAAFEEAAAEAGRKRAEFKANRRRGLTLHRPATTKVSRSWFDLEPTGRPGMAIVWKNVLVFTREFRPVFLIVALLAIGVVYVLVTISTESVKSGADIAAGVLAAFLLMTTVMSPIGMRNDLRGDLRHMELLRTYPISGRELVTGEIAGATLGLALMQAFLLAAALVFAALGSIGHARPGLIALAAALGLPLLVTATTIQCTIQNSLALFFPAWVRDTTDVGIEGMGHRILIMIGSVFLLIVLLLPAAILGGAAFAATAAAWSVPAGAIAAAVAAGATLWGEIAGALVWLGRVYDRLDPVDAGIVV